MQITQEIVDYGLLSELAYLRLENLPESERYNNSEIKKFITDQSKDTTGIDPDRKEAMLKILNNYTILDFKDTNASGGTGSGMQAMFVKNNSTGKISLLFRGTEFDSALYDDAFKADGYLLLGGSTQQMQDARDYANYLKNTGVMDSSGSIVKLDSSTVVAGHSLGGSLTQVVAYEQSLEAYAYNPLGVERNTVMNDISGGSAAKIHNFQLGSDIAAIGTTLGGWPAGALTIYGLGGILIGAGINAYLNTVESAHIGELDIVSAFYDNGDPVTDHKISNIVKTLDIYNNYLTDLFKTDDIDTITDKIATYSAISDSTVQTIGISRIAEYAARAIGLDTHSGLDFNNYANAESIFATAINNNGFIDLTIYNAEELASLSKNSNAILYATIHNTFITLNNESYSLYEDLNNEEYSDMQKEDRGRYLYYRANPYSKEGGIGTVYQDSSQGLSAFDKEAAINKVVFGLNKNKEEIIQGFSGDDRLYGNAGNDTLVGNAGNDYLEGGKGFDTLEGGDGHDVLLGGNESDVLYGGAGSDTLVGGDNDNASDALFGGSGEDVLLGGGGDDTLAGGDANNLYVDKVSDYLAGGVGHDIYFVSHQDIINKKAVA